MAGELNLKHTATNVTVKALVLSADRGKVFDGTSALVNFDSLANTAAWQAALVACTEEVLGDATKTGTYVGNFPTHASCVAGEYAIEFYLGASPLPGDVAIGVQTVWWTGTATISPAYGSGADLVLNTLSIVSATGDAVTITSGGGNGDGMQLTGNGTGSGLRGSGGSDGRGILATAGGGSRAGFEAIGQGAGHGIYGQTSTGAGIAGISAGGKGMYLEAQGSADALSLSSGTGDLITDGTIKASTFATAAITNSVLSTGAISAGTLAADTITDAKIAADAFDGMFTRDASNYESGAGVSTLSTVVLLATSRKNTTVTAGYLSVYDTAGENIVFELALTTSADANPVTGQLQGVAP